LAFHAELERDMLIEMKVSSLTVDPFTNMPILILKDAEGGKSVPIWIGLVEASAIATELEQVHLDRPMTHDLLKIVLGLCSMQVDRVEIHDLKNNTFYATIFLKKPDGQLCPVDARPSDAIALALRTRAAIFVARKVIDKASRLELTGKPAASEEESQDVELSLAAAVFGEPDANDFLANLTAAHFGKWKM
jgi:uncharacterized protein